MSSRKRRLQADDKPPQFTPTKALFAVLDDMQSNEKITNELKEKVIHTINKVARHHLQQTQNRKRQQLCIQCDSKAVSDQRTSCSFNVLQNDTGVLHETIQDAAALNQNARILRNVNFKKACS